jgi:hypothetical protein
MIHHLFDRFGVLIELIEVDVVPIVRFAQK